MTLAPGAVPTGNTYEKYASSNPIERRLVQGFLDHLESMLPAERPANVLEVGVGEGEVTARLSRRWPGVPVVGLDLLDDELAGHWTDGSFLPVFGDLQALPFPDDSFDLVAAIEVLEHVTDPVAALGELARVARRFVVASVPREPIWRVANLARGAYLRDLGNTPGHLNHWSKRQFTELMASRFDVTAVASPFPWTVVAGTVRPVTSGS